MLEKLGLPAKPAARGSSWVLDASHCQGCSAAFTVFNRKNHCRRCGGIFCANCTNHRLILRGQGEHPVRVCEQCRKFEEASRIESRPWLKNKVNRGGSKSAGGADADALLKQLLGGSSEPDDLSVEKLLEDHFPSSSARSDGVDDKRKQGHSRAASVGGDVGATAEPVSPEKLREQAQEERKRYTELKKDGKGEEALKAFKRSKELGRQAEALELALRKSKRKAPLTHHRDDPKQEKVVDEGVSSKDSGVKHPGLAGRRASSLNAVGQSYDLVNALKDIGWDDSDLSEQKDKPVGKGDFHSELAAILESAEDAPRASGEKKVTNQPGDGVKMQILGHKRRAVALKKEGKMAEAKEELKKAKVLERQQEEAALLGEGGDEEEDELTILMRSLEKEANTGKSRTAVPTDTALDFNMLSSLNEDDDDTHVDVSDADLNDPAMVEALRAMGWAEEADAMQRSSVPDAGLQHLHSAISREQELQKQILAQKERALALRREGKREEARDELKRAKLLEQELQELKNSSVSAASESQSATRPVARYKDSAGGTVTPAIPGLDTILSSDDVDVDVTEDDMQDPDLMGALRAMGFADELPSTKPLMAAARPSRQDTAILQQEILAIKRSALALKREGKVAEAKEQLLRSRALEETLAKQQSELKAAEELPNVTVRYQVPTASGKVSIRRQSIEQSTLDLSNGGEDTDGEEAEADVEESDYMDPDIAAALRNMGWEEDTSHPQEHGKETQTFPTRAHDEPETSLYTNQHPPSGKTKSELQKELLGLKRRALALKREGRVEEANEVLRQSRVLEKQFEEMELVEPSGKGKRPPEHFSQQPALQPSMFDDRNEENVQVTDEDMLDPQLMAALQNMGWKEEARAPAERSHETGRKESESAGTSGSNISWGGKDVQVSGLGVSTDADEPRSGNDTAQIKGKGAWNEDDPFSGEYGEIGKSVDLAAPLLDHPLQNIGNFFKSVLPTSRPAPAKGAPVDLLTGDLWEPPLAQKVAIQPPTKRVVANDEGEAVEDLLDPALMATLAGLGITDVKKNQVRVQDEAKAVDYVQRKIPALPKREAEVAVGKVDFSGRNNDHKSLQVNSGPDSGQGAHLGNSVAGLQQEILAHKRKALALKREGKRAEATDALKQAKLLELQLERLNLGEAGNSKPSNPTVISNEKRQELSSSSAPIAPPSVQISRVAEQVVAPPSQPSRSEKVVPALSKEHKQQQIRQGKDRMKLQQESLAHKRKALGLRREGKAEEAEAEFELAKALEEQMKELEPEKTDAHEVGEVENIFDSQLMAALAGLGLTDTAKPVANSRANQPPAARPLTTPATPAPVSAQVQKSNTSRTQALEDKIKSEKVRAVQLKRAGKPGEAMDALREAKKLEKQLLSLTSQ